MSETVSDRDLLALIKLVEEARRAHAGSGMPSTGYGQPLAGPGRLASVGPPRREQGHSQIDIGGAGGAQVRKALAGGVGAELGVLGRGDVLRARRVQPEPHHHWPPPCVVFADPAQIEVSWRPGGNGSIGVFLSVGW
jgi:hypothetical protein